MPAFVGCLQDLHPWQPSLSRCIPMPPAGSGCSRPAEAGLWTAMLYPLGSCTEHAELRTGVANCQMPSPPFPSFCACRWSPQLAPARPSAVVLPAGSMWIKQAVCCLLKHCADLSHLCCRGPAGAVAWCLPEPAVPMGRPQQAALRPGGRSLCAADAHGSPQHDAGKQGSPGGAEQLPGRDGSCPAAPGGHVPAGVQQLHDGFHGETCSCMVFSVGLRVGRRGTAAT